MSRETETSVGGVEEKDFRQRVMSVAVCLKRVSGHRLLTLLMLCDGLLAELY